MKAKHRVHLTAEQRGDLRRRIAAGSGPARELTHARILLKADQAGGGPAWPDTAIAAALDVSVATIERVRQRFVAHGVDRAVQRKRPARVYCRALDGTAEAHLIALACSDPPAGRARWSLQLLARRLVALQIVETVSDETVRRTLKKTNSSPGWSRAGASRPRPAASSSGGWRISSRSITARTTPGGP